MVTRERIREAALVEFAAKGESGFRVSAVSSAAGCATSVLYHHFGSRAGLIEAASAELTARATAALAARRVEALAIANEAPDLVTFLARAQERSSAPERQREETILWHVRSIAATSSVVKQSLECLDAERDAALGEAVDVLRSRGLLRDDLADVIVATSLEGVTSRWREGRFDVNVGAVAAALSPTT